MPVQRDTQELPEPSGSGVYRAFNINVNGVYHCSLRFKQLHNFYEQLRKEFGSVLVPPFPPKKLFSLAPEELEERRIYLEKWIQAVSQDTKIQNSHIFTSFFLNAQKETVSEPGTETNLDVFLMNGHKITVQIMSTDQTDTVHEAVCSSIQLNDEYVYYFGIFLVKKEGSGENSIVRRLQEFESPCLSLRAANKKGVHRLVLRKSYWDATWDDELLDDRVAMNLLYVQALSDIERGWVQAEREQLERLAALQQKNSKKEYLRLARTLKYYNYVRFKASTLDYPAPDTPVIVYAGNKQLNFIISKGPNKGKEGVFLVTRMRCWRITSLSADIKKEASSSGINSNKLPTASSSPEQNTCMELAVEYLVAKNDLKWITMQTEQAILISMCLQGMVDELMMKKAGRRIRRPQDREKNTTSSLFMKRDGTFDGEVDQTDSVGQMALDSVKRLSEKITSINLMGKPKSQRTSHQSSEREEPKNSAFGGIGDDDL